MVISKQTKHLVQWSAFTITLVLLALYVLSFILAHSWLLKLDPYNSIAVALNGHLEKPFALRVLLPMLSNFIISITPDALQDIFSQKMGLFVQTASFNNWVQTLNADHIHTASLIKNAYGVSIVILFLYSSLLVYAFALYHTSKHCMPNQQYTAMGTAILGLVALLPLIDINTKFYDFPILAFNTLGILFLLKERWRSYLCVFVLACFNKESAILLFGLSVICYLHGGRKFPRWMLIIQPIIFFLVAVGLSFIFAGNNGNAFHFKGGLVLMRTLIGFNSHHLMLFALTSWFLIAGWRQSLPLLRYAFILFLCADTIVYLFLGIHREHRVFIDVMPFATLIAGYGFFKPLENLPQPGR